MWISHLPGNCPVSSLSLQNLKRLPSCRSSSHAPEAWVLNSLSEAPLAPSRAFQIASPQGLESVLYKNLNVYQVFIQIDINLLFKTQGINIKVGFLWGYIATVYSWISSEIASTTCSQKWDTELRGIQMWSDTDFPGLASPPCLESWLTSCLTRVLGFKCCPKPNPYMVKTDVSGDTLQWQSCAAPGARLHLPLSALQKPLNCLWLMGIQSWSNLAVSAGQQPTSINSVVRQVPWICHWAALLLVHSFQGWASFPSQRCAVTSTRGSTLRANTGISVLLLCTSKTSKVTDGMLYLLSAGWIFHIIP